MRNLIKITFILCIALFVSTSQSSAKAATNDQVTSPKATITVKINVDQPDIFWNYTFLTKDSTLGKPANIKLTWSIGEIAAQEKTEVVVNAGKSAGQLAITAEKGALVNIRVSVCDTKNTKLGYIGLQVRNNGQSESVTMSPPEFTEPKITWGNF